MLRSAFGRVLIAVVTAITTIAGVAETTEAAETFQLRIFLDGRWYTEGARVQALIDGKDCTGHSYAVSPPSDAPDTPPLYAVTVLANAESPGCGAAGESVRWLIDGRAADELTAWPTTPVARYGPALDVFVGERPMVMSGLVFRASGLEMPVSVEAFIQGKLCATGVFQFASHQLGGDDSYHALVVPAEANEPGCGHPDAMVQIRVGGRAIEGEGTLWRPGIVDHSVILKGPDLAAINVPDYPSRWLWFGAGFGLAILLCAAVLTATRLRGGKL